MVELIFVNPEVHKIYIKRIGFSLIRVHRQQLYNAASTSAEVLLQSLKWPIEYLFVGMKVKDYYASSTAATVRQHLDNWHRFCSVTDQTYKTTGQNTLQETLLFSSTEAGTLGIAASSSGSSALTGTALIIQALTANSSVVKINGQYFMIKVGGAVSAAASTLEIWGGTTALTADNAYVSRARVVVSQGLEVVTKRFAPTMNNISVKAHGINIYDNFPTKFFNAYTSYHYGGPNVNCPEDVGALFIPFCLYP